MKFAIYALVFMYVGRRVGWAISRRWLYKLPTPLVFILCMNWGMIIALLIRFLIDAQEPRLLLRWVLGYWLGAYVASPNFGLFVEQSIPAEAVRRHRLVSRVPIAFYLGLTALLGAFA